MLVNSAGIYRVGALEEVTPEAWDATLAVNLRGTFLVCREVLPGMLARGRGSVVNLSSISGRTKATLAAPSYVASKAGVIGLTMSLAAQGAARGVRVNAVAPGPADTEMIRTLDQELQARLLQTLPMGRLATAREVAQAIVFLASPCASYITGRDAERQRRGLHGLRPSTALPAAEATVERPRRAMRAHDWQRQADGAGRRDRPLAPGRATRHRAGRGRRSCG